MQNILFSVVIPVYNSAETLTTLVSRVEAALTNIAFEIIFVDDCSNDTSWSVIEQLARDHSQVSGIRLLKNSGQHAALLAGIRNVSAPITITMDDDLQNPPEDIPLLLAMLTPEVDVVYGVASKPRHSLFRNTTGRLTRYFLRLGLGIQHSQLTSPFRAFRTQLRDGFASELGPGVSLDALLNWSTSRFASVEVEHHERANGKSNYNFWKLLRFMIDTATGYSTLPLRLATGLGLATITLSIGVLFYVLVRPLMTGESVPGFPFLAATIAIFSGTQLLVLGVIGQYIGRMHFRIMNKPTYTVAERTGP